MLRFGIISEVKPGFAKVFFKEDNFVTSWWHVIRRTSLKDKESWPLNPKEHVACMTDEHCNEGVVLGAIESDSDPSEAGAGPGKFRKVFEDGTILEYDKGAHKLTADVKGKVDVLATDDITATSQTNIKAKAIVQATIEAPDIQLKGNVTVVGVITAGSISASAMGGVAGADGNMSINGQINATGKISSDDEVSGSDIKAGAISLKTHKHGGVQSGGSLTAVPS
jgi:phage baseplate assembly protein V